MHSFHTGVFEDGVLKYQHSRLWRGNESLYKYSELLRPSESNTENKILRVAWERCSEQTIYLGPALLMVTTQLILLCSPLSYTMSKHDWKKYTLLLKLEQLFVKMVQSAGGPAVTPWVLFLVRGSTESCAQLNSSCCSMHWYKFA